MSDSAAFRERCRDTVEAGAVAVGCRCCRNAVAEGRRSARRATDRRAALLRRPLLLLLLVVEGLVLGLGLGLRLEQHVAVGGGERIMESSDMLLFEQYNLNETTRTNK